MNSGEIPINWGYAETMAYATLLDEGYPIRLPAKMSEEELFHIDTPVFLILRMEWVIYPYRI